MCLKTTILLLAGPLMAANFFPTSRAMAGTPSSYDPKYAPLPEGITSFGAAIVEDALYVYGGHKGRAHHYYRSGQVDQLWKLDLSRPERWEVVSQGPPLQGLAMVAHDGKLYRVGGFTAHNQEDEDHDLRSVDSFARYDPRTGQWDSLASLPQPRSSHDAVVIADHLYVVGGWQLRDGEEHWHTTAWVADLLADRITWNEIPKPPFQRRALSLGQLQGKLYVIGGMQRQGGPTTRVDIYDPATETWSLGPPLKDPKADEGFDEGGEGMEGFGSSAFAVGDRLFVSTYGGNLQYLAEGAGEWKIALKLNEDRFFHRMLPYRGRLLLLGGASMREGKRLHFEAVELAGEN